MPADLLATGVWQSTGPLAAATLFQCKGGSVQLTDTDPLTDLMQGILLSFGQAHSYPSGATVWYRSASAEGNGPGNVPDLRVRIAVQAVG